MILKFLCCLSKKCQEIKAKYIFVILSDKSLLSFICFVCVDTTLMVLSEDPEKSRSPVE